MKSKLFSFCVLALSLAACTSGKIEQGAASADTLAEDTAALAAQQVVATPADVIEDMETSELTDFAIKAWVSDSRVYWNVYDTQKFQSATGIDSEFYRIGDGPHMIEGLDELPIGVKLVRLDERGDLALYIITHRHHLYAYDVTLEVSQVGGGVGMVDGLEDVESIEQRGMKAYAVDARGERTEIKFYSGEGPYQCSVTVGEVDYYMEFTSTWNMRLVKDNKEYYSGRFRAGENGYYTFTLTSMFRYNDAWQKVYESMSPIFGSFRLNDRNSTIMFSEGLLGLPKGKPLQYEVYPLFQ